jgi:isocitrate/isopropylmalate dehydrogenase
MNVERKIRSYLEHYGNTRETDLINYGTQNLGRSSEEMKKTIDCLAVRGKIHRIVHNKIKPPEVYVTLEEPLPPEASVERQIASREVERILEEAASLAEYKNDENRF